ncbi:MAG: hypothetical protein QOI80_2461, partial [Solirubrobacteraceae bacterium]|nr:hypothetical protein [Solirubrobacteraceae bacterium]
VPALVLTAAEDDGSAARQLTKPFATEELVAAIRALLQHAGQPPVIEAGRLRIETGRRRVRRDGVIIPLTHGEFDALVTLAAGREGVPGPVIASLRRKVGADVIGADAADHRLAP